MADDEDQLDTETQDTETAPPEEAPLPEIPQEETPEAPKYGVVPIDPSRFVPGGIDRRQFVDEFNRNPGLVNRLASMVHGEVGRGASPEAQIIQAESALNRAQSRGHSLEQALWDKVRYGSRGYYPAASFVRVAPADLEAFKQVVLDAVMHGSDLSSKFGIGPITGNASGSTAMNQIQAGMPHFRIPMPDGSMETYFNEERRPVNLARFAGGEQPEDTYISPRIPEGRGQEQRFRPSGVPEDYTPLEEVTPERISPPIPENRGQEQRFRPSAAPLEAVTPENVPDIYGTQQPRVSQFGVSQTPSGLASQVEPYEYLTSRGHNLVGQGLNPTFAGRLSRAIQAAESATGQRAVIRDLYRSPETQAQFRANYIRRPVSWNGVVYYPHERGGLAAPPGQSGHQSGLSADIQRGPVLDYLHRHAREFGLSFLGGNAFARDPGHIRLAGSLGNRIVGGGGYAPVGRVRPAPFSGPGTGKSAAIDDGVGDELANLAAPISVPGSMGKVGTIAASPELDTEAPPPPGTGLAPTVTAGKPPLRVTITKPSPIPEPEPPNVAIPETPEAPSAPAAKSEAELLDALLEAAQPSKPKGTPAQQYAPGMSQTSPIEPLVEELQTLLNERKPNEPLVQEPMPDYPLVPPFTEVPPGHILIPPGAYDQYHTVTGADGQPQKISAAQLMLFGPMAGANKGFALSPENLAREFPDLPTEEQQAMTHGPGDTRPTLKQIYEQSSPLGKAAIVGTGLPLALINTGIIHPVKSAAELTHEAMQGKFVSNEPENISKAQAAASLGMMGIGGTGTEAGTVITSGMRRRPPKPQTVADLIKAVETREAQAAAPQPPQTVAQILEALRARDEGPQAVERALAPPVRTPQPAPTPQVAPATAPPVASPGGARGGGGQPPGLTQTPPPAAPPPPPQPPLMITPPPPIPPGRRGWLPSGPQPVPGTAHQPSPGDLFRMADDANAGLRRFMGRAGVPASEVERMQMLHNSATGAAGQTFATNAALRGEAHMPGVSYTAPSSFREIEVAAQQHPTFEPYMYARDTLNDIEKLTRARSVNPNPAAGPIRVRGMDAADARQAIANFEHADPGLIPLRDAFYANIRETRRFQHERGIISTQKLHDIGANRANEVPWSTRVAGAERILAPARQDANTARVRGNIFRNAEDWTSAKIREALGESVAREGADLLKATPNGGYILRKVGPNHVKDNPDAALNHVQFRRAGEPEHYIAESRNVADWLSHNTYSGGNFFTALWKSMMKGYRIGTTGILNWPFAFTTDPIRNTMIAKTTVGQYGRAQGLTGKLQAGFGINPREIAAPGWLFGRGNIPFGPGSWFHAVPAQLGPMLVEHIANGLLRANNGWFQRTFDTAAGRAAAEAMANAMLRWKANTLYGRAQAQGGFSGSRLTTAENALESSQGIGQWLKDHAMGTAWGRRAAPVVSALFDNIITRALLGTAKFATLDATEAARNAVNFAFIRANAHRFPLEQLVPMSRELTGNPQTGGIAFRPGTSRLITVDPGEATPGLLGAIRHVGRQASNLAYVPYSIANEAGRWAVPYYNMTQQGWKNRLSNPASFLNPISYLHHAPTVVKLAVGSYLLSRWLGKDENGTSYTDHMMYGQSPQRSAGTIYIPKPGAPAEQGWNVPMPQEDVLMKEIVLAGLHHALGDAKDIRTSMSEDFGHALHSYMDIAMMPPTNPALAATFEMRGVAPPQNMGGFLKFIPGLEHSDLGGEEYVRKEPLYAGDENSVIPTRLQRTIYALNPGFGAAITAGLGAFFHSPPDENAMWNAAKAVARQQAGTGFLSQVIGLPNIAPGSTRETEKMFERRKVVQGLIDYYKNFGVTGEQRIGPKKPISREGERLQGMERLPPEIAGLSQPPPKNELYKQFAKDFIDRVQKDTREGYKTSLSFYNDATKTLQTLSKIDPGNNSTWQRQLEQRPTMMNFLRRNNVDYTDRIAVKNALERYRQQTARHYNYIIDKIEADLSRKVGQPIRIQDLDPKTPWHSSLNATP